MSVPIQILKYVHAHPFCNLADLLNHVHPRGYTYSDVYRIFKDLRASNAILFFNGNMAKILRLKCSNMPTFHLLRN